jgi:hypothetical protein
LTGLEFFIFSHRVSAYVHLYWNLRTISWNFRASFEACNATALQIFQQRIRVADFSATHPRCRARRWNSWVLYQVHPCCRKISNADALLIFLQHGKQVPEFPEKFVGIKLHT